jgi:hypothetical protein
MKSSAFAPVIENWMALLTTTKKSFLIIPPRHLGTYFAVKGDPHLRRIIFPSASCSTGWRAMIMP